MIRPNRRLPDLFERKLILTTAAWGICVVVVLLTCIGLRIDNQRTVVGSPHEVPFLIKRRRRTCATPPSPPNNQLTCRNSRGAPAHQPSCGRVQRKRNWVEMGLDCELKDKPVIDPRPTIVLADSSFRVLSAACALLEPGYNVLKVVTTAEDAVCWAMRLSPDLAVMEICMPKMSGIAAARQINLAGMRTRIVLTADMPDDDYLREAQAVALGYVLKRRLAIDLVPALGAAISGSGFYLNQRSW